MKIGIMDSGAGGLTILNAIRQKVPSLDVLYLADAAFAPYGEKTEAEIQSRLVLIGRYFEEQGVSAIVVACNTATVAAIDTLRAHTKLPVIGVEPAVKPAFRVSKKRNVAVLATPLTAESRRLRELIELWRADSKVQIMSSDSLAFAIDGWPHTQEKISGIVKDLCSVMLKAEVDTLVLACTHYPLVKSVFIECLGKACEIIEPSEGVTAQLCRRLRDAYPVDSEWIFESDHIGQIELVSTKSQEKALSLCHWIEAPESVKAVRFEVL